MAAGRSSNAVNGLFEVTERVYQVRGLDLANLTIIEGDTGLILIDLPAVQRDRQGRDSAST